MKKRMISIVGWSSVLFILLGVCLFIGISARDISVARVGVAILLFTLAACANIVAKKREHFVSFALQYNYAFTFMEQV